MAVVAPPSLFAYLGIGALVVWRVYSRIRRAIGRQKLSAVRPWLTVTLFPLLLGLMALAAMSQPLAELGLLVGASIGVALGILGHRLTTFEATSQGLFYTPNAHLGIALSLLLIGRIGYRFVQLSLAGGGPDSPYGPGFVSSPLTLLIFGTLAGYYVSYAVGLLRWRRQVGSGRIG